MAQRPQTQTVWLHLLPTDIHARGTYPAVKKAHSFTVEKMTKSGPTSSVGKTGRVMVQVNITLDPDIFNQDIITANLQLDEANLVPVFNVAVDAPEPLPVQADTLD